MFVAGADGYCGGWVCFQDGINRSRFVVSPACASQAETCYSSANFRRDVVRVTRFV
jgi:hypothetical protein